ncbi:MAG: HlyD family efflux transporter periplasmic adaptor subunit [Firmicutes bacterium]|nr:HlyD family efflux transporter periplasmic adaptor subunit [Bacillota bacterium]
MKIRLANLANKRALILVSIPALIIAFLFYRILGANDQPEYRTAKVERGMIVSSVNASGQISLTNSVNVTTQATGVVKEVYVKEGDIVKAGDKLLTIELDQDGRLAKAKAWSAYLSAKSALDSALQNKSTASRSIKQANIDLANAQQNKLSLQQALERARADLAGAQKALNDLPADASELERQKKELELNAAEIGVTVAQQKYDGADAAIENARLGVSLANQAYKNAGNSIEKAQADVDSAWLSYQATLGTVTAPVDGRVGNLMVTVGTAITGSSSGGSVSSPGNSSQSNSAGGSTNTNSGGSNGVSGISTSSQKVATIVREGTPIATFNLSEIDIVKVKTGQKATITLDALPNKTFTGKVISIDKSGTVSSGVTTYPVTIQFDTTSDDILPNMATNASIITETKDDVLLIPSGSAQTIGNQSFVTVLKNGKTQQVPVELGLLSDSQIEVVSGLSEGDEIVLGTVSTASQQTSSGSSPFSTGFGGRGFGGSFGGGGMRPGGFGGR